MVPPPFKCWNPQHQRKWLCGDKAFRHVIKTKWGHQHGPHPTVTGTLVRRDQNADINRWKTRGTWGRRWAFTSKGGLRRNQSHWQLDSDLSTPRPSKNKSRCWRYLLRGALLWHTIKYSQRKAVALLQKGRNVYITHLVWNRVFFFYNGNKNLLQVKQDERKSEVHSTRSLSGTIWLWAAHRVCC